MTIPERPGSFRAFCSLLGARNITEFNYRYADPGAAHVFVGVQVRDRDETGELVRRLRRRGLKTLDFSDNELAKLHIRHMVGGHAPTVDNEILYRFEFPERPGALMKFLDRHEPATGTSACSTTATTAPTTGACWSACRCRRGTSASSAPSSPRWATPAATRPAIPPTDCFSADRDRANELMRLRWRSNGWLC